MDTHPPNCASVRVRHVAGAEHFALLRRPSVAVVPFVASILVAAVQMTGDNYSIPNDYAGDEGRSVRCRA
jgi:hypothetical protein